MNQAMHRHLLRQAMPNSLTENLNKGWDLVRNNPQIFYTVFVAIIIIVGFLFTSNQFLLVADEARERFEHHRVTSMLDAFVPFAEKNLNDQELLSSVIRDIDEKNTTIENFRVILREDNDRFLILASLHPEEVGTIEDTNQFIYNIASVGHFGVDETFIVNTSKGGERFFQAAQEIKSETGETIGWAFVESSLSGFDSLAREKIRKAYIILFGIIILILFLLIRHARIIDYTTLYKRLKEVDQMKDDFVSMASHELRTPLTAIRGYADLIAGSGRLSDQDMENIKKIEVSAEQLNTLVEDILDVSRLEQGRMKFEFTDVDVNQAVQEVFGVLKPMADQKKLSYVFEKGDVGTLKLDPDRFKQVITNLVGNAIKYTKQGEVKVMTKKEGDRIEIRVSDTGIGLTAEEQKNLFRKFYRARNDDTKEIRGTGLGLWISAEIIRQMNGSISVESIKGTGSHFIVSFPS